MLAVVMLTGAFVRISGAASTRVAGGVDDTRAAHLAEAGIREGMTAIGQGLSGNVGTMDEPAYQGDGVFWVEANDLGNGLIELRSTALSGSGRAAVAAIVRGSATDLPLFSNTLASKEGLTLNEGVMIDSYDSALGSYASQVASSLDGFSYAGKNGSVACNKGIALNANVHVFGDATPGPGYGVTKPPSAKVSGDTTPLTEPLTFPPIEIPSVTQTSSLTLASGTMDFLAPGIHGFDSLALGKASTLTVAGPATLVVNSFAGYKDAKMVVDATGGPVTIYVRDKYFHDNGFNAGPSPGSPMALAFLIDAAQDITFPSASKVSGAYYAPNASLTFTSSNEAWGSFVANKVSMSNDMKFHYDENLGKYWDKEGDADGDGVIAWFGTAVSPSSLRTDRRDPQVVLGVDTSKLKSPADSWLP
jgi:hypothetical protein